MRYFIISFGFLSVVLCVIFPLSALAEGDDLYSFNADEFTKKNWEWKGEVTITGTGKQFYQSSKIYPIRFPDEAETKSQEFDAQVVINSRWDWGWSRFYLNGDAWVTRSYISDFDDEDVFLREGYWQLSEYDPHSLEIGKRLLRWGKGYAFNPVALLERAKDPENPEASREGLWLVQGIWIPGAMLGFDSSSLTLIYLPERDNINQDYQLDNNDENAWGLKLYALIGTTDIDLYYVTRAESDETNLGADFASNIMPNFEVHGEVANTTSPGEDYYLALLGLRYLTENEVTWIVEGYHDSSGLTREESISLYESARILPPSKAISVLRQLQQQKTINRNYGYVKASVKEPFDWLYFTPGISWLGNLDDESYNIISQLSYEPSTNWTFQAYWQYFSGSENSQYGEGLVKDKLEVAVSYAF
jgi:hypothetical protein